MRCITIEGILCLLRMKSELSEQIVYLTNLSNFGFI